MIAAKNGALLLRSKPSKLRLIRRSVRGFSYRSSGADELGQSCAMLALAPSFASERGDRSRGRFAPGFTLFEIAVVLFLLGLMRLIAMAYTGGMTTPQLNNGRRGLVDDAT